MVFNFIVHHWRKESVNLPNGGLKFKWLKFALAKKTRPLKLPVRQGIKPDGESHWRRFWQFCGSSAKRRLNGFGQQFPAERLVTT